MTYDTIGIKELEKNLKRVSEAAKRGRSFTVVRNSRPIFQISPILLTSQSSKYTFEDLKKLKVRAKYRDLSRRIDEIAYGV